MSAAHEARRSDVRSGALLDDASSSSKAPAKQRPHWPDAKRSASNGIPLPSIYLNPPVHQ